jgi:hypothetical protein
VWGKLRKQIAVERKQLRNLLEVRRVCRRTWDRPAYVTSSTVAPGAGRKMNRRPEADRLRGR